MPTSFDSNGHLHPYQPIKMEMDELQSNFTFYEERKTLFNELENFVSILLKQLNFPLELWINGSFLTLKLKPHDIDIVIFIDDEVLQLCENQLFKMRENTRKLGIYFVRVYMEFHPKAFISAFDKTEWLHLFSKDKRGRPKGFAQIIIDGDN